MKITILSILLLINSFVFSQEIKYVNTEKLNVRAGAGNKYEVIKELVKNEKVTVISIQNKWSEIELENGAKGFVSSKFLTNTIANESDKDYSKWLTFSIIGILALVGLFKKKSFITTKSSSKNNVTKKQIIQKPPLKTINKDFQIKRNTSSSKETSPEFFCKNCGAEYPSLQILLDNNCKYSPTKKHQVFEYGSRDVYYCKNCGANYPSLRILAYNNCKRSPTKKHQPFEGVEKELYYCKHCGSKYPSLKILTYNDCKGSPTGKHQPLIQL